MLPGGATTTQRFSLLSGVSVAKLEAELADIERQRLVIVANDQRRESEILSHE